MAWRERKVAENGPDGEPAKSAGFRKNPRKHAGTVAIRRKKAPTENSWGFNNGGGDDDLPQSSLKARTPRNSLIINAEVFSHKHFPPTRPEKRFSPLISRHRTRVTVLQ